MLLAIDSGNTNIVFAVFDAEGRLRGEWRSSTNINRTADEYWVWLTHLMRLAQIERADIDAAILASVVPGTLFSLKALCRKYFQVDPLVVGESNVTLGIEVLVDRPEEVGADRLVNAVAAHERYGGSLIVLDFGTATTFDVVDDAGNYRGGVIAPGVNLSIEALHQAAAQLPRVAVKKPEAVMGKATVPAMQSGVYWGYLGLIEGLIARLGAEYAAEIGKGTPLQTVVATGGLAPLFADACDTIGHVDAELTLFGLYVIFGRNRSS